MLIYRWDGTIRIDLCFRGQVPTVCERERGRQSTSSLLGVFFTFSPSSLFSSSSSPSSLSGSWVVAERSSEFLKSYIYVPRALQADT